MTTLTEVANPRWVTGMPAAAGAAKAELTPGTTSNSTPAWRSASASSPAASEHERVPPLQPHHLPAGPAQVDELDVDLGLGPGRSRRLAHVDQLGARRGQVEQLVGDQAVVDDDVGPAQQLGPATGEQTGVAGAGADQRRPSPPRPSGTRGGGQPVAEIATAGVVQQVAGHRPAELLGHRSPDAVWRSTTVPSAEAIMPVSRRSVRPTRPPVAHRAWAPTGRVHPPPSSARKARSASPARPTRRSSIALQGRAGRRRRRPGTPRPVPLGPPGAA